MYVACAKVPTLVVTFMVMVSPEPSCSVERVPLPFSTNLTTAALPFAMFDKLLDVPVVAQDTLVLSEATMLLVWIVLFEIGAWMYPVNFALLLMPVIVSCPRVTETDPTFRTFIRNPGAVVLVVNSVVSMDMDDWAAWF